MIVRLFDHPRYAIFSPSYSNALRFTAKSVPGMRWEAAHSSWVGYPCAVEQVLKKLAEQNVRVDGELCVKKIYVKVKPAIKIGLREYQTEAVRFIVANAAEGVLCADDMGLGKTLTAIRSAKALRAPSIVVCPSFVRMVWRRELEKWRPKAHIIELWGVKPKEQQIAELKLAVARYGGKLVVLVHYDIVHAWVGPLVKDLVNESDFTTVIFDEIHYLQSDRSRRSGACRDLARACSYRIGLSGTPMTSRPRDLWNPVETLSPGRFGRPFDFYLAHADAKQETISLQSGPKTIWKTDGASRLEELRERLSWFMIRRTKSEVELELPPRTRQIIELEVARSHQRFEMGAADKSHNKTLMREALSHAADGKLPKVLEMVQSHLADGSKVVIFCHRVVIAQALSASFVAEGVDSKFIVGDIPMSKREEIIDSQPSVLCATMDSTQAGIDLTYANVALFVELDWVPSKLLQCEARLDRFGQKRNVLIQYLIALSTADEIIASAVIDKLGNFEAAIGKTDDKLRSDLGGTQKTAEQHLSNLALKLRRMFGEGDKCT